MPYVELVSRTTTSLTCRAEDLPTGATGVNWYFGTSEDSMPFVTSCDGDTTWTFSELQPNTLYYVKFLPYVTVGQVIRPAYTDSFYTLPNAVRPSNWAWESTVSRGAAINLTAAEWNRFIDRIFAFAAYVGISPAVSPSAYYVEQGTEMLASQFNAARAMINAMSPPTAAPSPVSPGGTITAAAINGLRDSLNSIV